MKCIKMTDGKIKRVKDAQAVDMVFDKKAVYANKTEYKKANGKGEAKTKAKAGSRNSMKKAAKKAKTVQKV